MEVDLSVCRRLYIKFIQEHGQINYKFLLFQLIMEKHLNIHILKVCMIV